MFGIILQERPPKPAGYAIWPENWPTVQAWMALQTQWHRGGMDGVRTGLIYTAIPMVLEMLGITEKRDVFHRLQAMEYAALEAMAKRSRKEASVD